MFLPPTVEASRIRCLSICQTAVPVVPANVAAQTNCCIALPDLPLNEQPASDGCLRMGNSWRVPSRRCSFADASSCSVGFPRDAASRFLW